MKYENFKNQKIPKIGFGTWRMGDASTKQSDVAALSYAYQKHNITLVDTAEMYADGQAECTLSAFVNTVPRESLFIVDKILPQNAKAGKYEECCRNSLKRVGVDYFDLYLLHWKDSVDLQDMVDNMQKLVSMGLIRHWGVSNFDAFEMDELFACNNGDKCFANQCLYNLTARGVEFDLIPWCKEHGVLFMAYSPLGNDTDNRVRMSKNPDVLALCNKKGISAEALMLAFVTREQNNIAIFKTSSLAHLDSNMNGVFTAFSDSDWECLERSFPRPTCKVPLEKI